MRIRISEIYSSRQGEGRLAGRPSVFVRTSGCNLRCVFCDSPFTSWEPDGTAISLDQIVAEVLRRPEQHVVITGGEPLLPASIVELTRQIDSLGKKITIETAGTIFRELNCRLMSISPKLANSTPPEGRAGDWRGKHEARRLNLPVLTSLIERYEYQFKFVVREQSDVAEILWLCDQLPRIKREFVLLMPEGIDWATLESRRQWILAACRKYGFTFCPRLHILWYGNTRGT